MANKSVAKKNIKPKVFTWRSVDYVPTIYTLIIFFGGLYAYCRTGSNMSLASSLICSFFLSIGTYKTSLNHRDHWFTVSKYNYALFLRLFCDFENENISLN